MKIIKLLNLYTPANEEEEILKSQMIDFAQNYDNIYSRKQTYGHFTGSGFVINSMADKFLLIYHKKLKKWLQPGGHCDEDNNLSLVALRESEEETGINNLKLLSENIFDIDIHMIPSHGLIDKHYHFDVRFLIKSTGDDIIKHNEESEDASWFDFSEDFSKYKLENSVLKMINKYKKTYLNG